MSIAMRELILYGCANPGYDDEDLAIGGAIDKSKKLTFVDIAAAVCAVSENAGDTTQDVTITYRDSGGNICTQAKTLTGQTPVNFTGTPERLIRAVKSATCAGAVAVQGQSAEHSGTSTAGTTSQITLQNTASAVDQAYRGMILRTTGGTGPNQIVEVLDYIGATKVAIVGPAFATPPSSDTTYTVGKGFFLEKSPNEILDIYRPCAQAYSALPGGAAKKYYEKFFWWNNHASLALTESTISEDSDPDAVWAFALEAALDGVTTNGGGNNRQVAPAGTFNSAAKNVANGQSLTAQTAQPGWLELSVAADLAALKTTVRLKLLGKTV